MELYKKYRPRSLAQVVGNGETVALLENYLDHGNLPHTCLFTGPAGCGKTTLARIVKESLECSDFDFTELNSASYRGIDSMRDIQSTMRLAPAAGPVRVWLLDECHQVSKDGQNAALKAMEDTPSHVYFLLCTTDEQKLIPALRSRATPFPVRPLTYQEMVGQLEAVCKSEKFKLTQDDIDAIVDASGGSPRTALVLLDKVAALPADKRKAAIEQQLEDGAEAIELCRALIQKKPWKVVSSILQKLKAEPEEVRYAVLGYARTVLLKEGSYRAYLTIDCFSNNFYDSKAAGLARACYEVVSSKE